MKTILPYDRQYVVDRVGEYSADYVIDNIHQIIEDAKEFVAYKNTDLWSGRYDSSGEHKVDMNAWYDEISGRWYVTIYGIRDNITKDILTLLDGIIVYEEPRVFRAIIADVALKNQDGYIFDTSVGYSKEYPDDLDRTDIDEQVYYWFDELNYIYVGREVCDGGFNIESINGIYEIVEEY